MSVRRVSVLFAGAVAASLVATAAPSWAGGTNLVQDPSFETPATPAGGVITYGTGASFGPWTVVGASGDVQTLSKTFQYGGVTFKAKKGAASIDLTGNSQTATGVQQTVATTAGASYKLTFYVGNAVNGSSLGPTATVNVSIDGTQALAASNSGGAGKTKPNWKRFTVNFTASSGSTALTFLNGDPSSDTYAGLDGIKLTAS